VIGFYDYTVILTYLSAAASVLGMTFAANGHMDWAVTCLILAGICDGFDGKVARSKKNRTEQQKMFGIQIDSLCDMISFGFFPVIICHYLGMTGPINDVIKIAFVLAAVIRLGYYNVMEEESLRTTSHSRGYFQGMPVTSIAIILPTVYAVNHVILKRPFDYGLSAMMAAIAVLFVTDVKIKKPNVKLVVASVFVGLIIMFFIHYRFSL